MTQALDLLRRRVQTTDDDGNRVTGVVQIVDGEKLTILVDADGRCDFAHCPHHRMWLTRTVEQVAAVE